MPNEQQTPGANRGIQALKTIHELVLVAEHRVAKATEDRDRLLKLRDDFGAELKRAGATEVRDRLATLYNEAEWALIKMTELRDEVRKLYEEFASLEAKK